MYPFKKEHVRIVYTAKDTDASIAAMRHLWDRRISRLDCEWQVDKNNGGMGNVIHRVRVIQLSYLNRLDNKYYTILILTNGLQTLPVSLIT